MNGDSLIIRVRRILKDEGLVNDPSSSSQGIFWSDREIILALNTAQSIFLNYAVSTGLHYLLSSLIWKTPYMPSQIDYVFPATKPLFHYLSAQVGTQNNLKPARIYEGGAGAVYEYVGHKACVILNRDIYFLDKNQANPKNGQGILYYYTYPAYIGATSLGDDPQVPPGNIFGKLDFDEVSFEENIYELFANHAAVICGTKEVVGQRDFKKYKRVTEELLFNPQVYANFVQNSEFTGIKNEPGRPKELQPQGQGERN